MGVKSRYTVKVEEERAATEKRVSAGGVYRCIYTEDGLTDVPEGVHCPWDFFCKSVEENATCRMLGSRQIIDGKVYDSALQIGSAIRKTGVNPGDQCGIYGSNCPKWIIAMQACNSQAISYVPLYDSLGANAVEFIINHAEVSLVFVREKKIPVILACLSKCTSLKTIVSFEDISSMQKEVEEAGVSCFTWEEFSQLGTVECQLPSKEKTDVCTIMYTSGTTGEPKRATTEDVYFSFLPLVHIFDQIAETFFISKGTSIGFWQGYVRYLMEDLQELKPTMFCGVPRIYDRLYTGIVDKISSSGFIKKGLFDYAYKYKLLTLEKGLRQDEAAPLLDKFVFSKIKQSFGGRVRIMISGGAPLARHVEEFLRVACCSAVVQGYGLTESCGGCFTSIANVHSMMGTVGIPSSSIEERLESIPEMEYDALSGTPHGEICVRGNSLFSGYHKRQDLIQEVFIGGWFHTGDIGEWQPDGSMKIIDRKNIFKLSQGEYVAVENLENIYSRCNLITSIWVYGNSFESFLWLLLFLRGRHLKIGQLKIARQGTSKHSAKVTRLGNISLKNSTVLVKSIKKSSMRCTVKLKEHKHETIRPI